MEKRIGNFKIYNDSDGEHEYVVLSTVGEEWELSYRDDHPMYAAWVQMMMGSDYGKAAEVLGLMYYMMTNSFVDEEFADSFLKAHAEMMERRVAAMPEGSEEEEFESLKEAEMLNEMARGNGGA